MHQWLATPRQQPSQTRLVGLSTLLPRICVQDDNAAVPGRLQQWWTNVTVSDLALSIAQCAVGSRPTHASQSQVPT